MRNISLSEMQRMLQQAAANDGTTPLRYEGGYTHTRCGGPAEMATGQNLSAFCRKCQIVVPSGEIEQEHEEKEEHQELDWELAARRRPNRSKAERG